jgi:hypothetical protein
MIHATSAKIFRNTRTANPPSLLGPGDLCSHVILVERRHFDVHVFCHQSLSSEVQELYHVCTQRCF